MKMKHILLYALFFFLLTPPLYGQDSYSEFERGLQLSEPQRIQTEEAKRRYMNDVQGLNHDLINKRLELRELYRNPSANQARIERLQRELGAIDDSRHNLYNQYRSNMWRVLTPEQRGRYNSYVDSERRKTMSRHVYPPVGPPMDRSRQGLNPPSYRPSSPPRSGAYPPMYQPVNPPRPGLYPPVGLPMDRSRQGLNPPAYRPSSPPRSDMRTPARSPSNIPQQGRHGR